MKTLDTGQSDIFVSGQCTPPPPPVVKKLDIGQSDILVLADVPPPPGMKKLDTGQSDILVLPPFHYHYLILCLNRKLVNLNFKWMYGLEPHPPPLSSQRNKMLIFGLRSTSGDWLGWSMDSNPIHHPSPTKKVKCSFLDYVQLLMIGQAGRWTRTPSTTPFQSKNKMLIFGLCSTSDDRPGWSMDLNPICHPSPAKKIKCSFLDYVQLLMIGQAGQWTRTPSATPLQQKNKMLIFGLCSTSDDRPGWLMDSNPIHHPSPAKKIKCSFLDYVQLLMIGWAG